MAYDVKAAYEKKKKEAASGAGSAAGAKKYNVEAAYISAKKEAARASSLPTGEKKQSVVQGKPQITPNNAADILKQTVTKDFEASGRISASPASLDAIQRQQIMDEAVRQLKIRQGLDTAAKIAVDNSRNTTQPQIVADQQRKAAAVPYQTSLKSYADSVKRAYAADQNDNTKTDAKQVPLYLATELGAGFMSTLGGIYSGAAQTVGDLASGGKYSEITKYLADNPADRQALEIAYKSYPKDGGHIYDVILGKVAAATGATKEMVHQARRSFETDDLVQASRDSFDVSSGFKSTAGNVAFMVGQQIPAVLLTAGGSGAAFEAAISQGIMAGSAYGQKLKENSKKYGFDMGSYASAVAAGAIEALTENLDNFTPTMNSILKIATLGDLAKTAIGEGLEEAVGYPIENIIDWLVLDGATNREGFGDPKKFSEIFDMGEWTRNFIDGTVVGGLIGAGGVIANIAGQRMNGTISAQEAVEKVANAIRKNGIELQTPDVNTATDAEADQFVREAASALVVQAEEVKAQAAQQEQQGVPEQANNLAAQNEVATQAQQTAGAQPKKGAEVATEMGLGKHGAEAAEKAGITPENVGAFTAYWNAGHEGRSLESVQTSQGGLDEVSQKLAYNAGQQDAAEEGLDVREWTTYDGRQEATGDGESILRQGGERYDGQSSGQPLPEMEAGTGRDQSGYVQTRPEESRVVGLEYSAEKVNSKQAGLEDGLEDDGIYLIKGGTSLDYMDAEAEAKRLGLEFVPFAGGDIHTLDAPGGARGCVANGKMYVRMDDPDFSGAQISRHEGTHELIRQGAIDVKKTLRAVADKYGESFVKRMTGFYNAAYAGMDLTEDEIEAEMVCDARGQMNIFKGFREFAQDAFALTETVLPRIREEAANGGGTRAGPEGAQYSRRYDYPSLNQKEWDLLNHSMSDEISKADGYVDKATKWLYKSDKGVSVFSIYGIGDGTDPTPLYASGGKRADADQAKWKKFLEGDESETNRTRASIDRFIKTYEAQKGRSGDRVPAVGRRTADSADVQVLAGERAGDGRADSGRSEANQQAVSQVGVELDEKTESAAPGAYSRRTWLKSQYATDKAAAAKALSQQLDVSLEQAEQYIDNVNSVAKMIADDEVRLDYEAAPGMSSFVGNTEYGGSIDFSTICKKRRLLTGTFEAIQRLLPNTALTAEEILTIRKMMADRGYEVSCGLCYVEGSRANMGQYTKQFLDEYAKTNPKYLPNMAEMNTASGQEKIRIQHPEVYAAYEKFMNSLAQRKPKMYQMATEYQGEILKKFKGKKNVAEKNKNGGLRLQSFSDFEIIHLIDCMQVIMDMSQVGLAGQAYTKVPDFAAALGSTGLKINLSLIAKGVDAKGKLVLDEVEGMARADAEKLRNQYSDNVGTIIVVFTDVQLQAAMNDPFIDYIIPFHRSQWNSQQYELMGLPKNAKDFTSWQNESYIEPVYSKSGKKQRPANYMPNEYWDFSKSGTENAKTYLQMCHENNRRPKFHYLLDKNADGSYSLKEDGSTDGYWKLLIDFKMYNNEGVGVEQMPVKPEFNMAEAERMLRDYQGGHETFPAARDVVDEFVESYKAEHEGPYSRRLNPEDVRAALDVYREQYGVIEPGEKPFREVQMPKKTGENENVSKTVRTILEAKATPEAAIPTIEQMVANGDFSYETITDKQAIADAQGKLTTKGWSKTLSKWLYEAKNGTLSKDHTVTGWALYNNAANAGDLDTAMTILEKMVLSQRNAAQALQATRVLKKLSPEAQLYAAQRSVEDLKEELNERYGAKNAPEIKIDPTLAEAFMTAKTEKARDSAMAEIYKDVGKQMPSTFRDKWNAWRYLAMLGNPRTHVRNILGNAGFVPIVAAKNLTATAIEKAVNAVTGGKTGRSKAVIGTSAKDKALLSAAWADYDNVQGEIMAGGKYSDFQVARQNIEEGRRIFKNRVLEAARRGNSRAMEAEDAWFSKPHYAYALAGYCKANGITPEMVTDGKAIQTARAYAIREAQKATYRDTNAFSQTISDLGKVNKTEKNGFKNGMGVVLQGILPFRKTPANILVRGVEYSPIGLVKTIALDSAKVKRGDMTATEMIDNLSAGLTGTGLLALGAFLAAQGLIRGHGPDDDKKEFEELQGHQAYSLEVGGTSITLDWLAPECLPFFVGVNLYEQSQATGEELTMSTILSAITNVSEPMLEMSCLQSLNDVFDAVGYASSNDLSAISSILASAATSYLTQALPTIFGQAERTGQDVRYTTYTTKDAFLTRDMQYAIGSASARTPGWDYNQIPYIDAWGRREDTGGLAARAFGNFANPSYTSTITGSEMEDELMRVYDETGEASVFPTRAQRSFPVDGEQHYLSADEYVRYATTKGETSYNLVSDLVEMRIYDRMSEEDKVDAISDAYSLANVVAKYEVSDYETTGWMAKAVAAKKIGIDYSKYLEVRLTVKDIESIKDSDGDSVSNSKGLLVMDAIYKIPGLNDKQRRQLFEDFGVGKSIIDLNKAAVEAKLKNMR